MKKDVRADINTVPAPEEDERVPRHVVLGGGPAVTGAAQFAWDAPILEPPRPAPMERRGRHGCR